MNKSQIAGLVAALSLCLSARDLALGYQTLATERPLAMPSLRLPDYLQTVTDPAFGTPFTRVTDPGRPLLPGLSCYAAYCTHRYSSSQAWNADQSLLLISNGCAGFCFLDGATYVPLFHRSNKDDCQWHPVDPSLMICVSSDKVYAWNPRSDQRTAVHAFPGYTHLQFGPNKGNLSRDGTKLVVRALNGQNGLVAFAYDLSTRQKYPDIDLSKLSGSNGYCTISPSGRYVFCVNTTFIEVDTAYVFTIEGVQLQHWTEHHRPGHGDMTVDADGSDVYVGISKADPDKYHIIKRRLIDGSVTDLAPCGSGQHASMRNINRPGWVFVTYDGTFADAAENADGAPFYQEIIAMRIDGSGEVRRIVQTHDVKYDYWSETHASPSPDGSQVIWSSNWGRPGGPVADFVARLSWSEPTKVGSSKRQ